MRLSVVMPTHNRESILRRALQCLEAQSLPLSLFEVIVVDDASSDATPDFLRQYHPPYVFRYFRQNACTGPARARNVGILAAGGKLVVIVNDDTLLAPDALEVHLKVHEQLAGQRVSVLGRFDLPEDFTRTLWGYALQNSDLLFRYPALEHNGVYGHDRWWSCNISTPRTALLEAGLFDEDFTGGAWGAEDQELGLRLLQLPQPVPVLYRADCRATHMHHLTVDGFASMSWARGGGGALLFAKHGIPCHYSNGIREQDVAFWRNVPPRLRESVENFHARLQETESLRLPIRPDCAPYYHRDEYPQTMELAYRIYTMRTRELLELFRLCSEQLEGLLSLAHCGEVDMPEAGKTLYPLCFLLRFYHDSIGICATDAIYRHVPQQSRRGEA